MTVQGPCISMIAPSSIGRDEKFDALDDKTYTATNQDCAICDESGILGLGGIVGGESTGCDENTTEITPNTGSSAVSIRVLSKAD